MKYTNDLPSTIGVYIFKSARREILYIGKSVNIKARVKSHFENAKLDAKERAIVTQSSKINTIPTESEFKALLLESQLIQKHRPKYNKIWMDDKSYLYVKITTSEEYPKIFLVRKTEISECMSFLRKQESKSSKEDKIPCQARNDKKRRKKNLFFGPFSSRRTLEQMLREIRRVIPFCTAKRIGKTPCFYSKINLCNPCPNVIHALSVGAHHGVPHGVQHAEPLQKIQNLKREYRNNIRQITKIFEGNTDIVLKNLRRELDQLSRAGKYEEAILMRDRILKFEKLVSERSFDNSNFSGPQILNTKYNIQTVELQKMLKVFFPALTELHRIECYDVSNFGGKQATAAMTVAVNGQIDKSQYRKFKILSNTNKNNDVIPAKAGILIRTNPLEIRKNQNADWQMMLSVLQRRFAHEEWQFPNLILVDGGKPQVRMAISAMQKLKLQIPVIGIAKNPDRLVIGTPDLPTKRPELNHPGFNLIRLLRDEAHRFGRKYHLLLRQNKFLKK